MAPMAPPVYATARAPLYMTPRGLFLMDRPGACIIERPWCGIAGQDRGDELAWPRASLAAGDATQNWSEQR